MKIKELLNESASDIVARFYKEASLESEQFFNPEVVAYKNKNKKYYDDYLKDCFEDEIIPVFRKPVTPAQPEYTNIPKPGKLQSPGFRGLQYTRAAAGIPYDKNVQSYVSDPSKIIATQAMDAARNNNGQ